MAPTPVRDALTFLMPLDSHMRLCLRSDSTGEWIGPELSGTALHGLELFHAGALTLAPEGATFRISEHPFDGRLLSVTAHFRADRLRSLDLFLHVPGEARDWSGWTIEAEHARKADAESWAATLLGTPLVIKPIVLPELDRPIIPARPGPEDPRHALFEWGEVCSYYDSKAGFAGMWVRYGERPSDV